MDDPHFLAASSLEARMIKWDRSYVERTIG